MAFRELSQVAKEAYLNEQVRQLIMIYKAAQNRITAALVQLDMTNFNRVRSEVLLQQVNQIVDALNRQIHGWAKGSIPQSYDRGIDLAAERLKALNVTRFVSHDALVHTQAVNVLVDDVTIELLMANDSVKKFLNRVIRQTQQRLIEDAQISKMIAEGVIEGQARRTVSDEILRDLRAKLGNEQFVVINGRNYRPDKYAELVARTRTREATSQGTINTSLRYGVDLCQIDVHSGCCEYCQQFSGRVYSISGNNSEFPPLREKPPYHPNCLCTLLPITRESLEARGYLGAIIKLSSSPFIEIPSFSRFEEVLSQL